MPARTLAALLAVVPIAACGGSGVSAASLETAVRARTEKRIAAEPLLKGVTVTELRCVKGATARVFVCSGRLSNGRTYAGPVTVSEDGKDFVSEMQ